LSYKDDKFKKAVEESTNEEMAMWRCPNVSHSCWRKAHSFYIERGLWGKEGSPPTAKDNDEEFRAHGVKVSAVLYKNKEDWMLKHKLISKKGGTRGRKSKKRPTSSTAEPSTRKTKQRRRNEKTSAGSTSDNAAGRVSGNVVNETNSDNGSSDNDELQLVTQRVNV
jgi:hypothetical protein